MWIFAEFALQELLILSKVYAKVEAFPQVLYNALVIQLNTKLSWMHAYNTVVTGCDMHNKVNYANENERAWYKKMVYANKL